MRQVDQENVAWAAGLFDGDGTFSTAGRYPMVSVGGTDLEVVMRFARVVGGGNISGPYQRKRAGAWNKKPLYYLQAYRNAGDIAGKLWPYLGRVKRERIVRVQSCAVWRAPLLPGGDAPRVESTLTRISLAWAAGFFDAEGCFSFTKRSGVCASITNTDRDQLERFAIAVGIGKIYGPYRARTIDGLERKPHYFFRTQGPERTQALAALLWFQLGDTKKSQVKAALGRVRTTCRRGHSKRPGQAGCGQCMRDYWEARRGERRGTTGESSARYLIA